MSKNMQTAANAADIIKLECDALDRWGNGDPGGFLDIYAADISYFDPLTAQRIDGHREMTEYYRPWTGKIHVARYQMLKPQVVIDGNMALLTYNLLNYLVDTHGAEIEGGHWNSTVVYRLGNEGWKSIHSHWSFMKHPAFQPLTVASPETPQG